MIEVPVLRQFGLVENEKVDRFLATAFGKTEAPAKRTSSQPGERQPRGGEDEKPDDGWHW